MKTILITIAMVITGMVAQAQNYASTVELRSTFKSSYLKSLNTETWRLKYDVKFDNKTMIVYMVYQNQNDNNTATAKDMFNDGYDRAGYSLREKMKDMLKITYVKYVISYKGKSPHSTYKGAY